jgi:flagellar operon protein
MSISDLYRAGGVPGGISPVKPGGDKIPAARPGEAQGPSEFHGLLKESIQGGAPSDPNKLNFSQHAETRIRSRAIPWDAQLEARIRNGLNTAQSKGSREALILADNVAVIANVKSRTIVTAMDRNQLKERIFTNIDSAVLV